MSITHYPASEGDQSLCFASDKSIMFSLTTILVQWLIVEFFKADIIVQGLRALLTTFLTLHNRKSKFIVASHYSKTFLHFSKDFAIFCVGDWENVNNEKETDSKDSEVVVRQKSNLQSFVLLAFASLALAKLALALLASFASLALVLLAFSLLASVHICLIGHMDPISLLGLISLIDLISRIGHIEHNGLFDFNLVNHTGFVGCTGFVCIVEHNGLIGLVSPDGLVGLIGINGLVGFIGISLSSLIGFISLFGQIGLVG